MNYYDEILNKIEQLAKDNKIEQINQIIDEELKQIYIPKDFLLKLNNLKEQYRQPFIYKTINEENIEDYLFGTNEQQLLAVDWLNKCNLRDYFNLCNEYLSEDRFKNAKVLLIDSLIKQEIGDEFHIVQDGMEYYFIPKYSLPVEKSDGFITGKKFIEDYYLKDPSKMKMALDLLYKEMMLNLPLNYEESEGEIIGKNIIEYIEKAFN